MVLPRVLTAIVLIPVVLGVAWNGGFPFFLFIFSVCLLALWEYLLMTEAGGYPNQLYTALFVGALILLALYIGGAPIGRLNETPGALLAYLFGCGLIFFREFFRSDKSYSFLRITTTLTGVLLCCLCLGHLMLIRDMRFTSGEGVLLIGRQMFFFLLFVIWATDTGAWAVGKLIGRFPLASQISPRKTWEGTIAGLVFACLVGWLFREVWLKEELSRSHSVLLALGVAIVAQISDLAESLVKRALGAKDSSQLLPGHGGILDRFDSFIFAAPFFYYTLILTGRFY